MYSLIENEILIKTIVSTCMQACSTIQAKYIQTDRKLNFHKEYHKNMQVCSTLQAKYVYSKYIDRMFELKYSKKDTFNQTIISTLKISFIVNIESFIFT